MRIDAECPECLERLIRRTADMATSDPERKEPALRQSLDLVRERLKTDRMTIRIAADAQRLVRRLSGNPDPFRLMKDREIEVGRKLFEQVRPSHNGDLRSLLSLSVLGNRLDFFRDIETVRKEIGEPVSFAIDDIARLEAALPRVRKVLFLADNAGECYFDLPLVKWLEQRAEVAYVVKEGPIQNDLLVCDLRQAGLYGEFPRVITTGTDSPGVDLDFVSEEFRRELENTDLLLAKGMGCWETLTEYKVQSDIFYLLMAKCLPVARSLGVQLNGYVARFVSA